MSNQQIIELPGKKRFEPNPTLPHFAPLIGKWTVEIFFPGQEAAPLGGEVSFEWTEEGAFIKMTSQMAEGGPPNSIGMIGGDGVLESYQMIYFDARGVARIYQTTLAAGVWQMHREAPIFSQRFTGTFSSDSRKITAAWEKSGDGENWEHDFGMVYTRADGKQ